jgi:hypothetical protein
VGDARNVQDRELPERLSTTCFEEAGFDCRGKEFDPLYVADLAGASSVGFEVGHLAITIWRPGEGERAVRTTRGSWDRVGSCRTRLSALDPIGRI